MKLRLALATVGTALLMGTACAHADERNACAAFYDAAKGDRGAADVYVGVERGDNEPACFLVPRVAIARDARHLFSDGTVRMVISDGSNHFDLPFDPVDLRHYLGQATSIAVGSEQRAVAPDKLGCLMDPSPAMMTVMPGRAAPSTIAKLSVRTEEVATDIPGYHRYDDQFGGNYYVAGARRDIPISFWCSPEAWAGGVEVCGMAGEYDHMAAIIQYFKSDMLGVKPEAALECVRTLGDLFRVR